MKREFFLTQTLTVSCLFSPVSRVYLRHFKGFRDFPGGTNGKEPPASAVDLISSRFDPWMGKIPWRRARQPLQYSCLENPHGQRSLAGYSPQGGQESDMTEATQNTCKGFESLFRKQNYKKKKSNFHMDCHAEFTNLPM